MALITVYHTVENADGNIVPDAPIRIRLILPPLAESVWDDSGNEIAGLWKSQANANGYWELDLTPQSIYTPDNTLYEVTEIVPLEDPRTIRFVVPDSGGPYDVQSLVYIPV